MYKQRDKTHLSRFGPVDTSRYPVQPRVAERRLFLDLGVLVLRSVYLLYWETDTQWSHLEMFYLMYGNCYKIHDFSFTINVSLSKRPKGPNKKFVERQHSLTILVRTPRIVAWSVWLRIPPFYWGRGTVTIRRRLGHQSGSRQTSVSGPRIRVRLPFTNRFHETTLPVWPSSENGPVLYIPLHGFLRPSDRVPPERLLTPTLPLDVFPKFVTTVY